MYITTLCGQVKPENRDHLLADFDHAVKHPPEGLLQAYLSQCDDEGHTWQLITIWPSREACQQALAALINSVGAGMFCEAGSVPERQHFTVRDHYLRVG